MATLMNTPQRIDPRQVKVCPDCYSVLQPHLDRCPGCGADRHRRETLDRALMLAVVLLCFGIAWSFLAP